MVLDCFEHKFYFFCIKIEFKKITNFLDTTSDTQDLPRFLLKNGLNFTINQEEIKMPTKKLKLKHQCQDQICVIILMHILL